MTLKPANERDACSFPVPMADVAMGDGDVVMMDVLEKVVLDAKAWLPESLELFRPLCRTLKGCCCFSKASCCRTCASNPPRRSSAS